MRPNTRFYHLLQSTSRPRTCHIGSQDSTLLRTAQASKRQPGLIDVSPPDTIDRNVDRSSSSRLIFTVPAYFLKYKPGPIKLTMTTDVPSMGGLGIPPSVYDQNGHMFSHFMQMPTVAENSSFWYG